MFTGLIETVGRVAGLQRSATEFRLGLTSTIPLQALSLGESVAVNGVCLTVVEMSGGLFYAQVSPETLRRSTLEALRVGAQVNLERALRLGDRLGGHLVLGHVDGVGQVLAVRREQNAVHVHVSLATELQAMVVEKGSIAVDGVSLTVSGLDARGFTVTLVPFSAAQTTLGAVAVGQRVNIEVDIIGKHVSRLLGLGRGGGATGVEAKEGVSWSLLERHGFGDGTPR